MEMKDVENLKEWLTSMGYRGDYLLLVSTFRKSFQKKQEWRKIRKQYN